MVQVVARRVFRQPVSTVFARFTDNEGWSDWAGLGRVRLVRTGSPERDGVGAVRAFAVSPGLREEIVELERDVRQVYRVTAGALPLRHHRGEVRFEPEGAGTRVTWTVTFDTLPGLGRVLRVGLRLLFWRILRALARDLDGR